MRDLEGHPYLYWEGKLSAEFAEKGCVELYRAECVPSQALPASVPTGKILRVQIARPLGGAKGLVALTREVDCANRQAPLKLRSLGTSVKKWQNFSTVYRYLLKKGWIPDPVGLVSAVDYHYTYVCFETDRLNFRGKAERLKRRQLPSLRAIW